MSLPLRNLLRAALALSIVLVVLASATAQPPFKGKGKGKDGKDTPRKAEASSSVDAWIKTLTDKMTDRQDSIRDSARAALVAIGEPALPALKKIAQGDDAAAAEAAKKVIARIGGGGPDVASGRTAPGERPGTPGERPGAGRPDNPPRGPGGRGPGGPGGFGGAGAVERLLKDLDLTDKQKEKIKGIQEAQTKKMRETFEKMRDGKLDRDEMRKAFETNATELMKELKGVLTAEQMSKLEKAMNELPRGFGGGFPGGPGGGRGGFPGGGRGGFPGGPGGRPSDLPEKKKID